jgi:NAD(P)-dependent dehydrogenase (short-subunit alcohol dehydrogenase family)
VDVLAQAMVAESLTGPDHPVVLLDGDRRRTVTLVREDLGALATTGAGPAGDGVAEAAAIGLGRDSVVLLVGGARGITARFAAALAVASGCRIELAGRTVPDAEPEPPAIAHARDLPLLRAALAGLGHTEPATIDRTAREILARREVAQTLTALRGHGSQVNYRPVDVRDTQAVRQLVKQVYAEHGRLDGVIYAAGVIDDRLIEDKDDNSFTTVYSTKVDGCATLLAALEQRAELPAFVVLFGSIAAALGNRGQADYAAANDAMETLGADWAQRNRARVLTVHWGPWAPREEHGGMVGVELARSYAGRGIELIDPEQGVGCLLRELAWGDPALRAVVLNAATDWAGVRP